MKDKICRPIFLILVVFILTRVMFLLWSRPAYTKEITGYQYDLTALCEKGYYPFIDYWVEYPPVFPWLSVGVYKVAGIEFLPGLPHRQRYGLLMGLIIILFEAGIICLIFQISSLLYGAYSAERTAWIYSSFFISFFMGSFFDSIPAFLLLLATYWIIWANKKYRASFVIALGVVTKLIPVILLPLLYKKTKSLAYPALVCLFSAFFVMPFVLINSQWVSTFVKVNMQRGPWETVWALLEKQYSFSYIGPLPAGEQTNMDMLRMARLKSRFSTDISYISKSSSLFQLFYLVCGLGFFLIFYDTWKKMSDDPKEEQLFMFTGFIVTIFFLYSKGWSPQFIAYVFPFILIGFTEKIWVPILLAVVNFIEMPIWLFFFPENLILLISTVLVRTGILVYCAYLFREKCNQKILVSDCSKDKSACPK